MLCPVSRREQEKEQQRQQRRKREHNGEREAGELAAKAGDCCLLRIGRTRRSSAGSRASTGARLGRTSESFVRMTRSVDLESLLPLQIVWISSEAYANLM